jgi:hypothetical protein
MKNFKLFLPRPEFFPVTHLAAAQAPPGVLLLLLALTQSMRFCSGRADGRRPEVGP